MLTPLHIMLIPALVIALSGVLALFWHPSHKTRSLIQHFAAGVVLAVLSTDVLPEITREHAPAYVLISSFALGGLAMYVMKKYTEHLEAKAARVAAGKAGANVGLITATFVDAVVDGAIIGAGLAASVSTGLVLAVGLSVEMLFLGLSLMSDTVKGKRMLLMTSALAATLFAAMWVGHAVLQGASHIAISAILSFGAAALVYLVTDELLIEAHTIEETPASSLWLFAGFLMFWAFQLYSA